MSARDHSCEMCGRGGMNDPADAEISRLHAECKTLARENTALKTELDSWLDWRERVTSAVQNPERRVLRGRARLIQALVTERDQARADLAEANKVIEAAKAWTGYRGLCRMAKCVAHAILSGCKPDGGG